MPDYKNNSRFKKPFTSGGPSRGPARFGRPNTDGPREMHTAECSKCHKSCQVPFRPNGTKPVFCGDCFTRDGDSRDSRDTRGSYQKKEYGAPRTAAPTEDRRIDELKRQLIQMDSKLDRLVQMIDAANRAPATKTKTAAPAEAPAKAKKVAVKKVVAKKAKKA
ncbi:MAG: hypothetical protein AB202_02330 [Parcubacteria bacterium C7867-007]|nr:MAG: hypothetical protein AB202_02330 [Parcubacteria bacterium C7867-007]